MSDWKTQARDLTDELALERAAHRESVRDAAALLMLHGAPDLHEQLARRRTLVATEALRLLHEVYEPQASADCPFCSSRLHALERAALANPVQLHLVEEGP